ncbi:MAG: flagellar hook-basal body complex protein, partial [Desulfovermiculus sp.]
LVSKSQNGFASGTLEDVSVDKDGIITGAYSNGQSRDLAQVGLAKFANPNGLLQDGNNLFTETQASGLAAVGPPGSGAGTIRSNSLEQSNVDIAEQFSDMIVTQRAYQANSRTITTSDEMLQEVINLKR